VQLGRKDRASYPAISNEELVLVSSGMQLYALEKETGRTRWTIQLPAHPSTSPAMDDARIYIGTLDGSLYAFDLLKIRKLFDQGRLPQWSHQTIAWRYQADKEITAPPVALGRVTAFASRRGSLYGVSSENRKLLFQFETNKPISAPLGHAGRFLYLAAEDFNFYALDSENGRVQWEFVTGLPIRRQPIVIDDRIYLTPSRGGMFSLNARTGRQEWWNHDAARFLAASQSLIYASDHLENVVLLSRETGAPLGELPLHRFQSRFSNERNDRLYLASDSGRVLCIRETAAEFPKFHKFPDRTPLLPDFEPETPAPPPAGVQPPAAQPPAVQPPAAQPPAAQPPVVQPPAAAPQPAANP
jgi:hypothetical protein